MDVNCVFDADRRRDFSRISRCIGELFAIAFLIMRGQRDVTSCRLPVAVARRAPDGLVRKMVVVPEADDLLGILSRQASKSLGCRD